MTRWARYGHDRLYVQTADGTPLGYLDSKTGQTVLEPGADPEAVAAALAAHDDASAPRDPASPAATTSRPVTAPEPVAAALTVPEPPTQPLASGPPAQPEPVEVPDTDLALVRAGAAAREQALALKQAAPVRTFLKRALGVRTDERAWRIGADAEEAVAARLARLGARWKVLHAVPVGENGSDIDHVVIGPGGVFTVNAKHHPDASVWVGGDTYMVSGQRVPYVRNSRFEARRTAKLLTAAGAGPLTATGVIAVMGARGGFTVKTQPAGVVVVTRKEVGKWLARQPDVLTDDQVDAVYTVARKASTWR